MDCWGVNSSNGLPDWSRGLNCCKNIIDAMGYVNMEILAEVEIAGSNIISEDKITSEKMRILRAWKWEKKDSVALSSYAAGLVEDNFNTWNPNDSRVRDCNALVRKWLEDPTSVSNDELMSARSAAEVGGGVGGEVGGGGVGGEVGGRVGGVGGRRSRRRRRRRSAAESAAGAAAWSAAAWSAESAAERQKMKNKIHRWVVKHISNLEEIKA